MTRVSARSSWQCRSRGKPPSRSMPAASAAITPTNGKLPYATTLTPQFPYLKNGSKTASWIPRFGLSRSLEKCDSKANVKIGIHRSISNAGIGAATGSSTPHPALHSSAIKPGITDWRGVTFFTSAFASGVAALRRKPGDTDQRRPSSAITVTVFLL
jgi:hypothetical protein